MFRENRVFKRCFKVSVAGDIGIGESFSVGYRASGNNLFWETYDRMLRITCYLIGWYTF